MSIAPATRLHAWGTEHAPRLGFGFGMPNAVFVFRPAPFDLKLGYDFTEGNEYLFFSGDLRFVNYRNVTDFIHFSMGIGGYGKFYFDDPDKTEVEGGARLPFAVSVFLLENFLEFFLEISPGLDFYPRFTFSSQPLQIFAGFTIEIN
jgi:hypothetical protein